LKTKPSSEVSTLTALPVGPDIGKRYPALYR
jgi:hypothetical protein